MGIDPSTVNTGWAIVTRKNDGRIAVAASGSIETRSGSLPERLKWIYAAIRKMLGQEGAVEALICEDQFMGKNARTLAALSCVKGVVMLAAEESGVPVYTYPPAAVKLAVAGRGNAAKGEVLEAIKALTGAKPKTLDESDAIAIGATYLIQGGVTKGAQKRSRANR